VSPFFRLKIDHFKATLSIEKRIHRCKNRILRSGEFCCNSESKYDILCGISRYQSPSCQCSETRFYTNCQKFMISLFFVDLHIANLAVQGNLRRNYGRLRKTVPDLPQWKQTSIFRMIYCRNICKMGLNPCQGYESQPGWIWNFFFIRSGSLKKQW
jgi:hypothetical protein